MNPRQLGSSLVHFLEIFADLCIVSVYWLVCCIPIVTIGASSAALYSAVTKAIRAEKGTLTLTFFTEFRDCLRQGIYLSLIFAGGCGLVIIYNILGESIPFEAGYFIAYWAVVIILTIILIGTFIYVFPLLARFRQKTWDILRTGFYMSAGYPIKTLGLICLIALAAIIARKAPLLMLFLPGAYTLLASIIQEPIMEKHTAVNENSSQKQSSADKNY